MVHELESNLSKNSQSGNSRSAQKTISIVNGGTSPGTFAHELLAIEYAGWISPAFRLQVNQTFLDYRTGKLVQNTVQQQAPRRYPTKLAQRIPLLEWNGVKVVTTETLVIGFGIGERSLNNLICINANTFLEEGCHCFVLRGKELEDFRRKTTAMYEAEFSDFFTGDNAHGLTLWTAIGVAQMAGLTERDHAQDFYGELWEYYFNANLQQPAAPEQRKLVAPQQATQLDEEESLMQEIDLYKSKIEVASRLLENLKEAKKLRAELSDLKEGKSIYIPRNR